MEFMWLPMYDEMYRQYLGGTITKQEWQNFCFVCLEELAKANKEILMALKNV